MTTTKTIPPLKGRENWLPWSLRMKALLKEEGLKHYIKHPNTHNYNYNYDRHTDKKNKGRILGLIFCHLDDELFYHFDWNNKEKYRTPFAVWNSLETNFGPGTRA